MPFATIHYNLLKMVLVAPQKIRELQKCSSLFMLFYLEKALRCADCVNQRVNRVNHSKRSLLQVKSAE